jgi:hypothetical protein
MMEKGGSQISLPHILVKMIASTKLLFDHHICLICSYTYVIWLSFVQYLEIILFECISIIEVY